ncbi:helix-turn-helix domain-containing protein [Cupriavidus basilensis]|uniref:Helix-turn-helix domain-containing protein n=2 Tax=Cupriavidus basilensis TaxID=68895 RepID=A0A7M2H6L5_9BURK|nr:helix-turn-helix domain-containing protein [Cupriavidus basilensis]
MTEPPIALAPPRSEPQPTAPDARVPHTHFQAGGDGPRDASVGQILAWRQRVGHVMDVSLTRDALAAPFQASIDRYLVEDMLFTDCRCDGLSLARNVARISTDTMRHYALQVFVEGNAGVVEGMRHNPMPQRGGILLTDHGQPIHMHRGAVRALSVFVPRAMMDAIFLGAEAAHGRIVQTNTPLTRLAVAHLTALSREIPCMAPQAAARAMHASVQLLTAAFRKGARLEEGARAAARSAMLARARRLIDADPGAAELSPDKLLARMEISRPTLYRLFEQEGGVQAYIRKSRLRAAAADLVKFPSLPISNIAYGLGFNSASDFTRAFRRSLGMSPSDLRAYATSPLNTEFRQAAFAVQGDDFRQWLHRQQC